MKNRTVSLIVIAVIAGIVVCLAGYLAMHPQKVKAQAQRVQSVNSIRTVVFIPSNSSAPLVVR